MGAIDLSAVLWPEIDQGRQPQGVVGVDPAFGLYDVYMPSLGMASLAAPGQIVPHATYFQRQMTSAGIAYGHTAGGLYTAAAALPAAGTYAAVLMVLGAAANGSNQSTLIGNSSAGLREQSGSLVYRCAASSLLTATLPRGPGSVIFASWRNGQHILYHRDPTGAEEYYSTTGSWGNASPLDLLTEAGRAIVLLARWRDSVPPLAIQQALVRAPWSLVTPTAPRLFWASLVGTADLAADGTALAASAADLTTAIPLAAAGLTVTSATGTVTTGIPIEAAGAAAAVSGGALITEIRISADGLSQALSQVLLSSGIVMTADSVLTAASQGTLSTAILMAADGQVAASSSVDLAVQIRMNADAVAAAASRADLATAIPLAAAGNVAATSQVDMGAGAQLAASGTAAAASAATLDTSIPLTLAAIVAAISAGGLTTQIRMSGQATADARGEAALWTQILIEGQGVSLTTSTVALGNAGTPWTTPVRFTARVQPLTTFAASARPLTRFGASTRRLVTYAAGVSRVH